MIRIYEHANPYVYKEFESHLFSGLKPVFDFAYDKLTIAGTEYRISTINYNALFNKLIDNMPEYTISFAENQQSYAVVSHDTGFTLNINANQLGCVFYLKVKKTTVSDIAIAIPAGSRFNGESTNSIILSGELNKVLILNAIIEGGEFDFSISNKAEIDSLSWVQITDKPISFTPEEHFHTFESIQDKPITFPADSHRHHYSELDSVPETFNPSMHAHDWDSDIINKPETFPPDSHTHSVNDITDIWDNIFAYEGHGHSADDISGLGDIYTEIGHQHSVSDIYDIYENFATTIHTHSWSEISDTPDFFEPQITISATEPTAPADGDIWILP